MAPSPSVSPFKLTPTMLVRSRTSDDLPTLPSPTTTNIIYPSFKEFNVGLKTGDFSLFQDYLINNNITYLRVCAERPNRKDLASFHIVKFFTMLQGTSVTHLDWVGLIMFPSVAQGVVKGLNINKKIEHLGIGGGRDL